MRHIARWQRALKRVRAHLDSATLFCLAVIGLDYLWPYLGAYLPISVVWFGAIGALLAVGAILARLAL